MQTKRDLLQAHRLMTHRAGQALILGEPDYPEQPLRRLGVGTFAGVMVAVLVAAGFGIAGILLGGGTSNLTGGDMVLIEKETGGVFVWCRPQGATEQVLCPVANYASAKLAVGGKGGSGAAQKSVSAKTLAKFKRGPMIGIPGAPDSVPDRKRLVGGPWSVCVRQADVSGRPRSVVSLVAEQNVGGERLDPAAGVVVSTQPGDNWLIWKNQRMKVSDAGITVLRQPPVAQVSPTFLNAIPEGPPFDGPAIDGFGGGPRAQGVADGVVVGQVFSVDGDESHVVLLQDGYEQISPLQAALIKARRDYRIRQDAVVQLRDVTANPAPGTLLDSRMPQSLPEIKVRQYDPKDSLCVVYPAAEKDSANTLLTIGGGEDLPVPAQPPTGGVDSVVLPPGHAVLAGVLGKDTKVEAISTYVLVTDSGRRYPLKNIETAQALGYSISNEQNDAVPVPANLLNLIPQGPTLDPDKAALPIPAGATGP